MFDLLNSWRSLSLKDIPATSFVLSFFTVFQQIDLKTRIERHPLASTFVSSLRLSRNRCRRRCSNGAAAGSRWPKTSHNEKHCHDQQSDHGVELRLALGSN